MKSTPADIKCYNCLGTGHHQSECKNETVCYKCKKEGHLAADCKTSSSKKLQMFSFGISGQGFYAINILVDRVKEYFATRILSILKGDATKAKVDKELKNLVNADWDFKVKQMDRSEFLVIFPDKSSLDTFTKLSEFQMSLFGLKGRLERANRDHAASSVL